MPDNGIKFFARGGHKLADEHRGPIESIEQHRTGEPWERPVGAGVGPGHARTTEGFDQYVAHLVGTLPNRLDGLQGRRRRCARRGRPGLARRRSRGAGAEVVAIGAEPDGLNINDGCGSHPPGRSCSAAVRRARRRRSASRTTATPTAAWPSTRDGDEVDGDQILAILALAMREARHAARQHRRRRP